MSDWVNININTEGLQEQQVLEDGMIVIASPSPYDVPDAIKADFNDRKGELKIQFRYIGTEPVKQEAAGDEFSFGLGKNSGRLYEIDVRLNEADIEVFNVAALINRISGKIDHLQRAADRQGNYRLAKTALLQARNPIASAVETRLAKVAV